MHVCMKDQNKRNIEMNKQYVTEKNNFVIIYYINNNLSKWLGKIIPSIFTPKEAVGGTT